jgi:hypothetical protein
MPTENRGLSGLQLGLSVRLTKSRFETRNAWFGS